jgi:hypothetical protein
LRTGPNEGEINATYPGDNATESRRGATPSQDLQEATKWATILNLLRTARPSIALSVADNLVAAGTTPGEPPSVQRNALTNSGSVERKTEDGYPSSEPPDNACSGRRAAVSQSAGLRNKVVAQ